MTKQCAVQVCDKPRLARGYCKPHYRRYMQYGDPEHVILRDMKPAADGHRVCNKCEVEKPLEGFHKSAPSVEGRTRTCKDCLNTYQATWVKANSDRTKLSRRKSTVKSKYGVEGLIQHERILRGEGCDACGVHRPRMAIDHSHSTGKVRGILCPQCNTALGLLKEDYTRFTALTAYLINNMELDESTERWLDSVARGLEQEKIDGER